MAWETRSGKRYFYLSKWVNGRVKKEYYGSGLMAELAAMQVESRKQDRRARRQELNAAKTTMVGADEATRKLHQTPSHLKATMPSSTSRHASETEMPALPPDVAARVRELLVARQAGDATADEELAGLVERFPALWINLGDLGRQALEIWVNLIAGKDRMLHAALRQKLDDLRRQFVVPADDPAGRLIADRVIATWLQASHADARFAQNIHLDLRTQEFLAKRQQQAQRQHLDALKAWQQWQRLTAQLPHLAPPTSPQASPTPAGEADQPPWIIPYPQWAAAG